MSVMKDVVREYIESANYKLEQEDSPTMLLSKLLMAENDAIVDYNLAIKLLDSPAARKVFNEILLDERKHAEQLRKLQFLFMDDQSQIESEANEENLEAMKENSHILF